jgi:homoserine dehydrogenase
MSMQTISLVLAGYGNVGRAFDKLVQVKKPLLLDRFGLDLGIQAVVRSRGGRISSGTLAGPLGSEGWDPGVKLDEALRQLSPGVLVECLSSHLTTGEPALAAIRRALGLGWSVAAASKGPLVADLKGLRNLAREKGARLKYSASVGAALPTLDVGLRSLAGTEILGLEGILNGTSNYILTRMMEGLEYDAALLEAQSKGIAEPDPQMDVEGWDTAAKLLIIVNSMLETDLSLDDIRVEGVADFLKFALRRAKAEGKTIKLLARMRRQGESVVLSVGPELLDASHPLFSVDGTNKGITYVTDSMGTLTVTGGKSDPQGAAAALLKDIIGMFVA